MELKRIKQEINRLEMYKIDGSITDSGLELLAELKHTTELVKNINYDAVLAVGYSYKTAEFHLIPDEETNELKIIVLNSKKRLYIKPNSDNSCTLKACR